MAETKLYSLEQMEILMAVASAKHPMSEAMEAHHRWTYILSVAEAAVEGKIIDQCLWRVTSEPAAYVEKAKAAITALDEWLAEQKGRRG